MLDILFITDYVCPYCLVAKEALKQAMDATGITANIRIQPMELTPVSKPRVDTYNDPVRREHYKVLIDPCKNLGLDMKLPPAIVPRPYSKLAFEGRFYAMEQGKEAAYNDLMYKAYFIEEKDIGDIDTLCQLVERIGLDAEMYREMLEEEIYSDALAEMNTYSRNVLKPSGLPTIYINDVKIDIREYSKEEMIRILQSFQGEATISESPNEETFPVFQGCGPDGC